jgi:ADP-ribose pyrophosphatase
VDITGRETAQIEPEEAFLTLERLTVVNSYEDGTRSRPYLYECVTRAWLDAVVLVLTAEVGGETAVCLRSSLRPPLLLRPGIDLPLEDGVTYHTIWELPAGLIETGERGLEGLQERAAAEALEETGYRVPPDGFAPLGAGPFVSPGVIPERMHYLRAAVGDMEDRIEPPGDGSPAEAGAGLWWATLPEALDAVARGVIVDMKTELGIRRLAALPG